MSAPAPRLRTWCLVLLLTVAASIRLYALDREPLWLDEAVSVHYAGRALFDIPAGDPHPHLYYAMLHLWISFGDSEWVVRSLSVILGVLVVAGAWALGGALGGARLAGLVATLAAVSPFLVRYSQEARMYELLAALSTLALWGLVRVARDSRSTAGWIAYVTGAALMLHTHAIATGFLALATVFLAAVFLPARDTAAIRRCALSTAVILILWAPAVPRLLRPETRAHLAIPELTWSRLATTAQELYLPGLEPIVSVTAGGLLLTLAMLGLRYGDGVSRRFLLAFALLPLPLLALVSVVWPLLLPRVLIWTVVPWLLLVARGALRLDSAALRGAAIAWLLAISLLGLNAHLRHHHKEAWDRVARHVAERAEVNDLVVFVAGYVDVPFDYYFRRESADIDRHPVGLGLIREADLRALEQAVETRDRVWVVRSHHEVVDPRDAVMKTLRSGHVERQRAPFEGVEVLLLRKEVR